MATDEVVVCARRGDGPYRLRPLPPAPGVRPPGDPLAFALPVGGSGRVHAFQSTLPGATGSGVAVTTTFPLGRKPPR